MSSARWARRWPLDLASAPRCSNRRRWTGRYSFIHLTNWVINGLPERFPKLKLVWVESGLAWIPFIMQRLDPSS